MLKQRVIAIDDGFFPVYYKYFKGSTVLAAIVYDLSERNVEAAAISDVLIDGLDATNKAISLVKLLNANAPIILDGVTYAGFNIVDPHKLLSETGCPAIVFFRHQLSVDKIRRALVKHFHDYELRLNVIERILKWRAKIYTWWGVYEYTPVGLSENTALDILRKSQMYSPEPEPLRIAGMLASKVSRTLISRGTDVS
ncbi:MAG: DUF99 family protein [Sulfolobales archaeon]|nr:DUF99 family protein [Sulfolobales archaeon]MCX8199569.1 DUF99 family protein [Sulfolobales archaeon]MDW8170522.1 DUF99 family protein [Desulfurococcaceae archaeon]